MLAALRDLLPEAADYDTPDYWAGLRPMTPDNCPYIGRGGQDNLYYNTGHGQIGWTMSNGSARIVAVLYRFPHSLPVLEPRHRHR